MSSAALDSSHQSSSHPPFEPWIDGDERGESLRGEPTRAAESHEGRLPSKQEPLQPGCMLAGRYRVVRSLGTGGFSHVYLAADLQLDRRVAVKRTFDLNPESAVALKEAKTVAALDHQGIVRIYDIIRDEQHGLLIVMQFVNGSNLQSLQRKQRLSTRRAVDIVKQVAIAASHAHAHGIVHRDIKPANILVDSSDSALLTDFGLAWKDSFGKTTPGRSGTLRYMSPEQMRDETHRIDARSDVFSLGIVLYELLARKLPFPGRDWQEVKEATVHGEPESLRSISSDVPAELERICRRALRKSVKDRFANMAEFADALLRLQSRLPLETDQDLSPADQDLAVIDSSASDSMALRRDFIVPRGLQPYRRTDSEWFVELVAGARHQSGLPEAIHAWKRWIESDDSQDTSRMGVLHGAPGSGKTSFVQAGVLANLSPDVVTVSVECRAGSLTARISRAIVDQLDLADSESNLSELIKRLRIEETIESEHRKVLIVLDQFEVWANQASRRQFQQLGAALRQCDGRHVQVLVVVADEYWTQVIELSNLVEVPLVEGQNFRPMLLLSSQHARKILELMGRTYGTLPSPPEPLEDQHVDFLKRAIRELGQDHGGRILPIQIAIFAEMAEMHHWSADLLEQAGELEGLYVRYLEDQFESETATSKNRKAAGAIARVLSLFLPAPDQSVRECSISEVRVIEQLELTYSREQIQRALRIVTEETKLLVVSSWSDTRQKQAHREYRIANDFLTEPIRLWTERVNKSTRQGLAISRFQELSGMWARQPDRRFLPSVMEYASMLWSIRGLRKSPKQRDYLRAAAQHHGWRVGIFMLAIALATGLVSMLINAKWRSDAHQREVVTTQFGLLLDGNSSQVSAAIENLVAMPRRDLVEQLASRAQIRMRDEQRCMLLRAWLNPQGWDLVLSQLDQFEPEVGDAVIRAAQQYESLQAELKKIYRSPDASQEARIRAAITLVYLRDYAAIEELFDFASGSQVSLDTLSVAAVWKRNSDVHVWGHLLTSSSESVRYCAVGVLGSFPQGVLNREFPLLQRQLNNMLQGPYSQQQASQWLARQAGVDIAQTQRRAGFDWMATDHGFEMVRVRVRELGPKLEGYVVGLDVPHREHEVWLASKYVSADLMRAFYADNPQLEMPAAIASAPPDSPAREFSLVDAARCCNWLSERDGLEPVYSFVRIPAPSENVADSDPKQPESGAVVAEQTVGADSTVVTDQAVAAKLDATDDSSRTPPLRIVIHDRNGYRIPLSSEMLFGILGAEEVVALSRTAVEIYVASGRNHEENAILQTREVDAMLPNLFGLYINDTAFYPLVRNSDRWCHIILAGDGGLFGFRREEQVGNKLTCLLVARNCESE